ncbi:hypothetical protein JOD24_000057 [Kroppenstedtia sanguinis]
MLGTSATQSELPQARLVPDRCKDLYMLER